MRPGPRLYLSLLLGALAILPAVLLYNHFVGRFHRFDGLAGPDHVSVVAAPPEGGTPWRSFAREGGGRLAILLTSERSAWLGLAHGLKALGVPFTITRSVGEAVRHPVVLAYPTVSGAAMPAADLAALDGHVRRGGTLVGVNVLGGLTALFGLAEAVEGRGRFEARLTPAAVAWSDLREPEEEAIHLGRVGEPEARFGSVGYRLTEAEALLRFEDGTAALSRRTVGRGRAYALGLDPGGLLLAGQNARADKAERAYVNAYTPQNDVLVRLLARIWREGDPLAVSLAPVPHGRPLAVSLTFDVDFTRSLAQAVDYGRLLREHGVRGTFFVQTKYMRDYNDDIIFNDEAPEHLRRLHDELGMELASHTVVHSYAFQSFEMGTGRERYPDYRPVAVTRDRAEGGSLLGEMRVSRFLLEALVPGARVTGFRPGHLSRPDALAQALAATGYRFSSTATAGTALSHLPFRLKHGRGDTAESPVFEFPITIEDELGLLMGNRVEAALEVARKMARHGGVLVVLTHPNVLGHKLAFNRRLIEALKDKAWFAPVDELGAWWAARDAAETRVEADGAGGVAVRLSAPTAIDGLTLQVPEAWSLAEASGVTAVGRTPSGLVLGPLHGEARLRFRVDGRAERAALDSRPIGAN